jgi:hypothetical protein
MFGGGLAVQYAAVAVATSVRMVLQFSLGLTLDLDSEIAVVTESYGVIGARI